jgi:hypothetical protein
LVFLANKLLDVKIAILMLADVQISNSEIEYLKRLSAPVRIAADPTGNLSQHVRMIRVWRTRAVPWVQGARGTREEERRLGFGRR